MRLESLLCSSESATAKQQAAQMTAQAFTTCNACEAPTQSGFARLPTVMRKRLWLDVKVSCLRSFVSSQKQSKVKTRSKLASVGYTRSAPVYAEVVCAGVPKQPEGRVMPANCLRPILLNRRRMLLHCAGEQARSRADQPQIAVAPLAIYMQGTSLASCTMTL